MKAFTYTNRLGGQLLAVLGVFSLVMNLFPLQAFAQEAPEPLVEVATTTQQPHQEVPKIKICHANGNGGYDNGKKEVNQSSIEGESGHDSHNDGGYNNVGDIIPPFDGYAGKNWTEPFISIYNSNCKADPKLIVKKIVIGTTTVAVNKFDLKVNATAVVNDVPKGFAPATYTVTETPKAGVSTNFVATFGDDCDARGQITAEIGKTKTCKITNNYTDMCLNVQGQQLEVPKEYTRDGDNCVLIPPPPVDVCKNLEGLQTEVPEGYTEDDGECNLVPPPPVDVCPNIEGNQPTIPVGMIKDEAGQCVTPEVPIDVCPNIEGNQPTIPVGMIKDDAGNCITPTVSQCTNLLSNASFEDPIVAGNWNIFATVAAWTISLSDGLELWANGFYGGASDGNQNAELDGNAPTTVTQTVATTPGATYELKFDFSARPDADSSADNSVDALVNGSAIMNATADGTDIAVNTWSTHTQTFVATGPLTDIGFTDKGVANSLGSLIDNTVLCLVRNPVPVQACQVNVVSDTSNTVTEKGNLTAIVVVNQPVPPWVASITDSVAQWIWGNPASGSTINPDINETQTFVKTFAWNGPVTSAKLKLSADNFYSVKVNGNIVGADATEFNYTTVVEFDVASFITTGNNTIEIAVTNLANGATNFDSNPGGLLYDLTVVGDTQTDCTKVPTTNHSAPSCQLTAEKDGSTVKLDWTTTNVDSASIDNGVGSVVLPNGSTIVNGINTDTTFTMTVYDSDEDSATCTASVSTSNGGGGGGSSGGRHHKRGSVAGDSTSNLPLGQVLGAATSTLPVGAPNTGAGGTSPVVVNLPALFAILSPRTSVQKSK